ncbi:MAG: creatininase [Rubrobacteraceae bacterium]|uniref:creatininase n=1 Tax=Rubrobacter naiadicus TaxID=1392641 RepID=UPI00235E8C2F|nr:creatininase [Rubrobacter naiadicus]MBX6764882.1 creatininase [Rubrobacteraceae bacterium]
MAHERRIRDLAGMTWSEVAEAIDRGAGVFVPVGSTEQHGYHLPLATDVILPTELAFAVADELDFLVAPPIAYGYRSRPLSGGGQGFVGTTSLKARTLMALVEDVLGELIRQGFERLAIVNWHFENQNFVYEAVCLALEHHRESSARILVAEHPFAELSEKTMQLMFPEGFPGWDYEHASIMETSLMLHLRPEMVLFDRAVDDASKRHPWYDVVPAPEDFVPASGTLWKATQASEEKGRVAWNEIVSQFRSAVALELGGSAEKRG